MFTLSAQKDVHHHLLPLWSSFSSAEPLYHLLCYPIVIHS